MKVLVILNDPPYGTERSYNGLRLAGALAKRDEVEVKVFLFGDAVGSALASQKLPDGYYHLDRMLTSVIRHGGEVGCCARVWMPGHSRGTPSCRVRAVPRWSR